MRLGDLGQLYDAVYDNWCGSEVDLVLDLLDFIKDSPTIDPETLPIVQELRKELEQYKSLGVKPEQIALLIKFFRERTSAEYIAGDMKLVADSVRVSSLEQELAKVTAERDAAISDLYEARSCKTCALLFTDDCLLEECFDPCSAVLCKNTPYKWRGIQEVQKDE